MRCFYVGADVLTVPRTCRAGMDCLDLREVSNLPIDGNEMMAVGDGSGLPATHSNNPVPFEFPWLTTSNNRSP